MTTLALGYIISTEAQSESRMHYSCYFVTHLLLPSPGSKCSLIVWDLRELLSKVRLAYVSLFIEKQMSYFI